MPKPHSFPTLLNNTLQLSITNLNNWGYLKSNQIETKRITWSTNGRKTGEIAIQVNTSVDTPFVYLDYSYNKEKRHYKVYLADYPSNIGKGVVWYFICPKTSKHCRKLYCIGGDFVHRTAYKGVMYECQTQSKKSRQLCRLFDSIDLTYNLEDEINSKYFKKFYKGKRTKRYSKILKSLDKIGNYPKYSMEELLMM